MSGTDIVQIGDVMPRLGDVRAVGPTSILVSWSEGPRAPRREVVDIAPDLFTYKLYRPLRDDPALFQSVHLIDDGATIAWGDKDQIDMPATAAERLAAEKMTPDDFAAFMKRMNYTFDAAAAQLGIARRLVAYYAKEREIPRYIALACRALEAHLKADSGRGLAFAAQFTQPEGRPEHRFSEDPAEGLSEPQPTRRGR